jgi:hypothetical protein
MSSVEADTNIVIYVTVIFMVNEVEGGCDLTHK